MANPTKAAAKKKAPVVNLAPREELAAGYAPDCLIWKLVNKSHAFHFRSVHERFTKEPRNVVGKNTPRFTGFREKSVLDLELSPSGYKVLLRNMNLQGTRRPQAHVRTVRLGKCLENLDYVRDFVDHSRPELRRPFVCKYTKLVHAKHDEKAE